MNGASQAMPPDHGLGEMGLPKLRRVTGQRASLARLCVTLSNFPPRMSIF
jgi:hypothetical protein